MLTCTSKYNTMDNARRDEFTELDRRIVLAAQSGLPLDVRPYDYLASELGVTPEVLMDRLQAMQTDGRIRRIGVVPNHYRLGYIANGMSVWDIANGDVQAVGRQVGAMEIVSHCYHRPRRLPGWPYNLFAMVHGRSQDEVMAKVARIAQLLGHRARQHDVLFSTRILKKTGLRLAGG